MSDALEMLISADIDADHVRQLAAVFVTASDEWHDKSGKPKLAREMAEATLVNLCDILQGAPDAPTRAAMANQAIAFIIRNCGASPAEVFAAHRAEMEGVKFFQPMGSA